MSRWFRHYAGMMRDEKLVRVSIRSGQPIERVLWIWGAILESAAEIDDNGRYDLDPAEVAYFLRAPEDDVGAVFSGLEGAGRIAAGAVVKWGNRQFSSDRSAARVAAHRERKRSEDGGRERVQENGNGDVTLQEQPRNSPELETETELETEVVPNGTTARGDARKAGSWPKPDFADPQHWLDVKQNRKTKRLPNTPTAYTKFLRDLEQWVDDEWPPGRVIEAIAARGWASAEHDPRGSRNHGQPARRTDLQPRPDAARGERPNRCLDMLYAAEAEIRAGEDPQPRLEARPPLRAIGGG